MLGFFIAAMHFVYIIFSKSHDKFYVGESVDAIERTAQHNQGFYKHASTSYTSDWELKLTLTLNTKAAALQIERYIKSMKSKAFIVKLITNAEFLQKFKSIVKEKFDIHIY